MASYLFSLSNLLKSYENLPYQPESIIKRRKALWPTLALFPHPVPQLPKCPLFFVCGVSNLAPIWQKTDFSDGFLYTARFGRTDAVGQANSHRFPGNDSWWLRKKAIKQPGGRDGRKQWQRTMPGITTECQDEPHGSSSWLTPLAGGWLCQTRSPVSREQEALTSQTPTLPLLWFIHQIVTETSFTEGTVRSLPRTNTPSLYSLQTDLPCTAYILVIS